MPHAGAMAKAGELGMTVVERVLYSKEYSEKTAVEMDDALVKFGVRFLLLLHSLLFFALIPQPSSTKSSPVPCRQPSSAW